MFAEVSADFFALWLHALFALFWTVVGVAPVVKAFNWSAILLPDGREEVVDFAGADCEAGQDLDWPALYCVRGSTDALAVVPKTTTNAVSKNRRIFMIFTSLQRL